MDVKDLPASIVDLPLFAGLTRDEVAQVLVRCGKLMMSAGQPLMKAGELADCAYVILSGRVEVRARQGKDVAAIATLEAGELVGEMGLFRDKPYRMADAVMIRDSLVVQVPYGYLRRLEGVNPEIASKLNHNMQEIAASRLQAMASVQRAGSAVQSQAESALVRSRAALHAHLISATHTSPPETAVPASEPPPLVPIQVKMALSRCPIFEGFDQDDLQQVIDRASARRFDKGTPVMMEGDPADCLFVVALGHLTVILAIDGEMHPVAQLGPGQCFGETALASPTRVRAASVVAETPATVLRLGYDDLERATSWRPETRARFAANLQRLVLQRT